MPDEPGPEDTVLVDTNVFVAVGDLDNSKHQSVRQFATGRGLEPCVPERVLGEPRTMHAANRVECAVEGGWATVVDPPEPTHGDAVAAMDHVRRAIARRSDTDEHEVEKADTVLAVTRTARQRDRSTQPGQKPPSAGHLVSYLSFSHKCLLDSVTREPGRTFISVRA